MIDDEPHARQGLRTLLEAHCPQVQLLGECASVPQAIQLIHTLQPQLIFLDIEMPGYSGLQLPELIPNATFQIIFTTAYSNYALQAFDISAVDYLLKPIRIERLKAAVQKAMAQVHNHATPQRMATLQQYLQQGQVHQLVLPAAEGYLFLNIAQIAALEAEGSYTRIHKTDGSSLLITRILREFEKHLAQQPQFFRCHRSFIINLTQISQWLKSDGGTIVLKNELRIPISGDRRDALEAIIGQYKV